MKVIITHTSKRVEKTDFKGSKIILRISGQLPEHYFYRKQLDHDFFTSHLIDGYNNIFSYL